MIDKVIAAIGAASVSWLRAREAVAARPGTFIVAAVAAVLAAGWWL